MSIFKKRYNADYFENFIYKAEPHSQRSQNRLKILLKFKNKGRLLEIGCGKGNFLQEAAKYFKIQGLELSPYASKQANQRPSLKNKIKTGDVEQASLPASQYDVVVAFNLLEHLSQPQTAINKLQQSLKKQGVLMGSVPNNFGPVGKIGTAIGNRIDQTHCSTYPPQIWRQYLDKNFNKVVFFGEIPLGRNHNLYLHNRWWRYLAFNLVFICFK